MKNLHKFIIITTLFLVFSCKNNEQIPKQEINLIEITKKQFEVNKMTLETPKKVIFENTLKVSATVVPVHTGIAKIFSPIDGFVKNIICSEGQYVNKNQKLIEITGSELIDIQKDFAITANNLKKLSKEYDRIKNLFEQKAVSEKEFISLETEYKIALANYNSLKLKIENLGLCVQKIENGEICSSFWIKAPIDGKINNINTTLGSNVTTNDQLLEIINPNKLQIKIFVFPQDINKIKVGQIVRFKTFENDDIFYGKIQSIGASVDEVSKTIPCIVSVEQNYLNKIQKTNLFVNAEVIYQQDSIWALPVTAFNVSENKYFLYMLDSTNSNNFYFRKQLVKTGRMNSEFVEIIDSLLFTKKILTSGAYTLE